MLSQKIATFLALMVFASQGVIGRPQTGSVGSGLLDAELDPLAFDFGEAAAALLPAGVVDSAIEGAGGTPP